MIRITHQGKFSDQISLLPPFCCLILRHSFKMQNPKGGITLFYLRHMLSSGCCRKVWEKCKRETLTPTGTIITQGSMTVTLGMITNGKKLLVMRSGGFRISITNNCYMWNVYITHILHISIYYLWSWDCRIITKELRLIKYFWLKANYLLLKLWRMLW